MLYEFLIAYLLIISLVAVVVTIVDKLSAIAQKRRVPERTLLTLSLLGGSVAMLVTMLIIRHKTRKLKFMIGIPAIILVQLILILLFAVML
ncbi:MAG: DUF1294 domain-containing protein [Ruminococcus sp.]|nr:DUF1294 domain-containing protein [Ruminococcus sp.]